jgi:hypothetical protein
MAVVLVHWWLRNRTSHWVLPDSPGKRVRFRWQFQQRRWLGWLSVRKKPKGLLFWWIKNYYSIYYNMWIYIYIYIISSCTYIYICVYININIYIYTQIMISIFWGMILIPHLPSNYCTLGGFWPYSKSRQRRPGPASWEIRIQWAVGLQIRGNRGYHRFLVCCSELETGEDCPQTRSHREHGDYKAFNIRLP